jgi:hypothetical protein
MQLTDEHREAALRFIYGGLKEHFEGGRKVRFDRVPHQDQCLADVMRLAQVWKSIASVPEALDAVHRMEEQLRCAVFEECPQAICAGAVWCHIYNGGRGQSHGSRRHSDKDTFGQDRGFTREEMLRLIGEI